MYNYNSRGRRRISVGVVSLLLATGAARTYADLCFNPCCVGNWFVVFAALELLRPPNQVSPACTEANLVTLRFTPSATSVAPQQTFDVGIFADIQNDIVAYGFHLLYDDTLLHLDALTPAAGFRVLDSGRPGMLAALAFPEPASGTNLLLGTATFTALGAGGARISAEVAADDPLEGFANRLCGFADWSAVPTDVPIVPPEGRVRPSPVPEPAALLMGLVALLCVRRR